MRPRILLPQEQQKGSLLPAPIFHSMQQIKQQVTVGSHYIQPHRLSHELSI